MYFFAVQVPPPHARHLPAAAAQQKGVLFVVLVQRPFICSETRDTDGADARALWDKTVQTHVLCGGEELKRSSAMQCCAAGAFRPTFGRWVDGRCTSAPWSPGPTRVQPPACELAAELACTPLPLSNCSFSPLNYSLTAPSPTAQDVKLDTKSERGVINEVADLKVGG